MFPLLAKKNTASFWRRAGIWQASGEVRNEEVTRAGEEEEEEEEGFLYSPLQDGEEDEETGEGTMIEEEEDKGVRHSSSR